MVFYQSDMVLIDIVMKSYNSGLAVGLHAEERATENQ